ncbi:MAG: hypothetical protein KF901_31360 [Myxococcales bacterium]|nr:hypothetical protein [Myxococcales bacterium]
MHFAFAGAYGLALSALIFSSAFTHAVVGLFVRDPYTLGTHGADWMYWHGVSCSFVGIVALSARTWDEGRPKTAMAWATGFVYGVWGLQNLRLVLATDRFGPLMWAHVALCLGVGVSGVITALRSKRG